jgi:hypothetical protein
MKIKRKWWLAFALICLVPATMSADRGRGQGCNDWWNWWNQNCYQPQPQPKSQAMPEGGSSAGYLIGAGAICLSAMLVRRRLAKASQ